MEDQVIILVRHAKAFDRVQAFAQGLQDAERPLTAKGKKEFADFAKEHKSLFRKVDLLLTSPYLRALETTKILQKKTALRKLKPEIFKQCVPDSRPKMFIEYLKKSKARKIVLVSHEPFLSQLICRLLGQKDLPFALKKGALVILKVKDGEIALHSLLNP